MSVTLYESGLRALFNGRQMEEILRPRAEAVVREADINASGDIIGIESGQLSVGIRYEIQFGSEGLEAVVGTDANKDGFSYPAWQDRFGGRPWLTAALRRIFPETTVVNSPGRF